MAWVSRWSARSFYGSVCEGRSVRMAQAWIIPLRARALHPQTWHQTHRRRSQDPVAGETNMTRTTVATFLILGFALFPRADARDLQQVLNTGTLRVGVTLYPPWAARAANGDLIGFEVDVAKQLAADLKVKADLRAYDVERLIPALESGEIDVIAAGLSITPARALHVNFSQPYAEGGVGLATHVARTASVKALEDLNGESHTIVAVDGSVAAQLAKR